MPESYEQRVARGELKRDLDQLRVAARLEALASALSQPASSGFLGRLLKKPSVPPRGLYIFGPVGRGKTMLMDLFCAQADVPHKRRVHFHAFMQDVHRRAHALRQDKSAGDVIEELARSIAAEAQLLCLDEMQIADISDAMLVGRLFAALVERGTVVVTTSNQPPDELYTDGLQRERFLPFIALLKEHLDVIELGGAHDYRLGRIKGYETWVTPLNGAADQHLDTLWQRLTDGAKGQPQDLAVLGRSLKAPEASHGVARFSFAGLCEQPLGPADYLAIATHFRTVFVDRIPVLRREDRNAAKRFILLIDTLYDAHTRLVASAAAPPEQLYPAGNHQAEFARTASRLQEMQSAGWWGGRIVET